MDLEIKSKVVLITGAAKGIGAAISRACAAERAIPVIVDKDRNAGEKLRDELMKAADAVEFISADLITAEACRRVVQETITLYGRLDGLINNAGVNDKVGLETGNSDQFIASLQRNLFHYYNMAHYALPFLKQSRGVIVNISSKTAVTGQG